MIKNSVSIAIIVVYDNFNTVGHLCSLEGFALTYLGESESLREYLSIRSGEPGYYFPDTILTRTSGKGDCYDTGYWITFSLEVHFQVGRWYLGRSRDERSRHKGGNARLG